MARVHLPQQVRHLTGRTEVLELEVEDYRSMMDALEARFPEVRTPLEREMAVVIDGDIVDAPLLEPLAAGSEVHFLPRLGGG
ncbi:MAG: MoaD/ThiS family protein [Pseudomonadales bacterium]|nr:MoaD/ThiS family protein [Pseudomonadales bacterium]